MKTKLAALLALALWAGQSWAYVAIHEVVERNLRPLGVDLETIMVTEKVKMVVVVQETTNRPDGHEFCVNYMQNLIESSIMTLTEGSTGFALIERKRLDSVLAELKLSYIGVVQGGSPEIGKVMGVNYILFTDMIHHVSDSQSTEIATAKLVRVETGEILFSKIIYSEVKDIEKGEK